MKVHSYFSETGRDLIMEYIDSLTEDERIDALSVLECIEKMNLKKYFLSAGKRKYMKSISENIIVYFM